MTLYATDSLRKHLQARWRSLQANRLYRQHKAAILVQRCFRGFMVRLALSKQHAAAVCIQKTWKRHTVQARCSHTLHAIISIQVKVLLLSGRGTTASPSFKQTCMHTEYLMPLHCYLALKPISTSHKGVGCCRQHGGDAWAREPSGGNAMQLLLCNRHGADTQLGNCCAV